jgi:anti-anti-sigma regulatory factor
MGGEVDLMSEDWKRFELHTTHQGETTCIALLGDFDLVGLDQLEDELQMAESRGGRATLDLRSLKFTDSTGSSDDSLGRDLVA